MSLKKVQKTIPPKARYRMKFIYLDIGQKLLNYLKKEFKQELDFVDPVSFELISYQRIRKAIEIIEESKRYPKCYQIIRAIIDNKYESIKTNIDLSDRDKDLFINKFLFYLYKLSLKEIFYKNENAATR